MVQEFTRGDPDRLLESVQKQEAERSKGKLKIFLGMAAGVGKTCAMLQQAITVKQGGVDVVVGVVETHGRKETDLLSQGFEAISRKKFAYKGVTLYEMDLDALLARKPALALVDELAHTNVGECRHAKRFQDVLEILDHGIDVWTTMNVQHLESKADTVRDITGINIAETVPDAVLDRAGEVVLIDLPPEDLLNRLKEGKVYPVGRAQVATQNFFKIGNLTALREMALRVTATQVDHALIDIRRLQHVDGQWKTSLRLMVAVYASPFSERLIRATRHLADSMKAPWYGVYVNTGAPLSKTEEELLAKSLSLVQELGGEALTIADPDPVSGILRLARENNVSLIVVGRSLRPFWYNLVRRGTLVQRLLQESKDIDIYVLTAESTRPLQRMKFYRPRLPLGREIVWMALTLAVLSLIGYSLLPMVEYRSVGFLYLLAIAMLSLFVGPAIVFWSAVLSALAWDFLFIPPRFTFAIKEPADVMLLFTYFGVAAITGLLTYRLRKQQRLSAVREMQTSALYLLAKDLSSARSLEEILQNAITHIAKTFEVDVVILIKDAVGSLYAHRYSTISIDLKEMSVAAWVMEHGRPAGRLTDTLPFARLTYLPIATAERSYGVLGLTPKLRERLQPDARILAEIFTRQLAVALEREELHELSQRGRVSQESERLTKALINCVSHELKTPLVSIQGASSALIEPELVKDPEVARSLAREIYEGSLRLTRLVDSLLDISRIEAGGIKLHKTAVDLKDLVAVVLRKLSGELTKHSMLINIPDGLPAIEADSHLIEQVIANLLHNVAIHTPPGTITEVDGWVKEGYVALCVKDNGPGFPAEDSSKIFDKFYRVDERKTGTSGLGLAIVRGFVDVHGGKVEASRVDPHGAAFTIKLPIGSSR